MKPTTFAIQKGYKGREMLAIISAAESLGASYAWRESPQPGEIPIGTVEFCEPAFGDHAKNFYPPFLDGSLHRGLIRTSCGQLYADRFVKDATAWKSDFVSGIRPSGFILPSGDWWVSEPVRFMDEWRYYIADGSIVTSGWYQGDPDGFGEDAPAPELAVEWPEGFSGAVDFGTLPDGRVALVECHAPFACGWYGEDHKDYALWQALAWEARAWWSPW